ncbi:DUF2254 domain-containing protein [Cellulomonas sp. JH27-2]|nr:DUF2254 domain-containing protein [Cellulomonas sp. JH27-2]
MSGVRNRWGAVADRARSSLWPVPVACIAVALALGVLMPRVDRAFDESMPTWVTTLLFGGGPDAARTVLDAVASSLITVTSLTFSLTVVTLQLASSQFSPRLLRTFTRDRFVHWTLGVFLGTFAYALTVLRTVRSADEGAGEFVPRLSVTTTFVLAIVSVVVLVLFLAHLASEIRVETMLLRVQRDAADALDASFARDAEQSLGRRIRRRDLPAAPDDSVLLLAPASGFLVSVDDADLLAAAGDAGATIRIDSEPGSWLVEGVPIGRAWSRGGGQLSLVGAERVRECVARSVLTGTERTSVQDIAFGLRQLTDVATKALSPGINDPTTAVHALGHASTLLSRAARHQPGPVLIEDDRGRVILVRPDLADLIELAVSGPRRYGAADPDVLTRLLELLREVAWASSPDDHAGIALSIDRLHALIARRTCDDADVDRLLVAEAAARVAMDGRWTDPAA